MQGAQFAGAGSWAGALVWGVLSLLPGFDADGNFRVLTYSVLALAYTGAAIFELWPARRRDTGAVLPVLFLFIEHFLFNLYRMMPRASFGGLWTERTDFALTAFESVFFVVGLAFTTLAMVRARTERHYQHASLHDALTGLPNRRALFEWGHGRLLDLERSARGGALLMLDLDWFKRVNDEHGHEAGDAVLRIFGEVLRRAVDPNALCARLGGEEFVVLLLGIDPAAATLLANRVRADLAARTPELPRPQTVSVGIAAFEPDTGSTSLDRLLTQADQALYAAKAAGRDCVRTWPVADSDGRTEGAVVRQRQRDPFKPSLDV